MWFKQVQVFQLQDSLRYLADDFIERIAPLMFKPCLPSMSSSAGWIPVFDDEDAPLVRSANGFLMLCLQIEEKVLPATVIRQELDLKVKELEAVANRKIRQKEKLTLKDEITITLLQRAFSKFSKLYAYIDTKNHWLVVGSNNAKKIEQLLTILKKSIGDEIFPLELVKLSPTFTHWLIHQSYPQIFGVEKACVFQDPTQQSRVIRCQEQNLFANSMQTLIKEGCEVKQIALSWHDRVNFMLSDDFSISGIKFQDEMKEQIKEMEAETPQQRFDADFFMMTEVLSALLKDLLDLFMEPKNEAVRAVAKPAADLVAA